MKQLAVPLFRRDSGGMKTLHILPHCLQFPRRPNGKFRFGAPVCQPDAAVAGTCNQLEVVSYNEDSLFFAHFTDKRRAPRKAFGILPRSRLVKYDDRLVRKVCHYQRQFLHLPAGKRKRVTVATFPHAHVFEDFFRSLFKFRRYCVPVLQLVQNGICEKLKFSFLHNEQNLFLKLFWLLRLAEKRDFAVGGAVKSRNHLTYRGFSTAVGAHQPDDFMLAGGKAHAGENDSFFFAVCIAHIRNGKCLRRIIRRRCFFRNGNILLIKCAQTERVQLHLRKCLCLP